jgi:hypothetical protein
MQFDSNIAILSVAAIAVVAALIMIGLRLSGKKSQSRGFTVLWVLIGVAGAATIVFVVNRPQIVVAAAPDTVSNTATTSNRDGATVTHTDPLIMVSSSFLACAVPVEPGAVPDGSTATSQQMVAARASILAYDAATTAYLKCVDSVVDDGTQRYAGVADTESNLRILKALGDRLHNAALDKDQVLANQLNQQIRVFKAKHGS